MGRSLLPALAFFLIGFSGVGGTACGGTPTHLQAPAEISLPPGSLTGGQYNSDLHCEWIISPSGQGYQLEFDTFDLQGSPSCVNDFLAIYTGSGEKEMLIDRWCGQDHPQIIVLSQGRVVFRSDETGSGTGFKLKVKYIRDGAFRNVHIPISVTERPVLLYAPYYGETETFGNNLDFGWKLTAPNDTLLQIEYRLECQGVEKSVQAIQYNEDFTKPISTDLLRHICGHPFYDVVVSNKTNVLIKVTTTSQANSRSFRLVVSAVTNYTSMCTGPEQIHNINVSQYPVYLTVPIWEHLQFTTSPVAQCRWHVTTDLIGYQVAMEMLLDTKVSKCEDKSLEIFDGSVFSSKRVLSECGGFESISHVSSPEMMINASVRMHHSYTLDHSKLFIMKLYAQQTCEGGVRTLVAKDVKSYAVLDHSLNPGCTWHIKMSRDSGMKTITTGVKTGSQVSSISCGADPWYLDIYTGSDMVTSERVSPLCPDNSTQDYRAFSQDLYLSVGSSPQRIPSVLPVYFYATRGICDRLKVIHLNPKTEVHSLFSPNNPYSYWPEEHCRWLIHTSRAEYRVGFRVLSFAADNQGSSYSLPSTDQAHLAFYDGTSSSSSRLLFRSPGLGTDWIISRQTSIFIEFRSFQEGGKFEILYKAARNDSSCNKEVQATDAPQTLSSPGFPVQTDRFSECWWLLESPMKDQVVYVHVIETSLNLVQVYRTCDNEYVEAYDGKDGSEGKIIRWCGTETPNLVSTGRFLFLQYKTGSFNTSRGFLLSYVTRNMTISKCGSSLKAMTSPGFFSSPNWPQNYNHNMDCEWVLTAESDDKTVKIEVIDSYLEYDCSFDNVSIYDGASSSAQLLQIFCAQSRPILQSTSRYMFIRFRSDSSRTHRGFRIKYYQTEDHPPPSICNKRLVSGNTDLYLESPGYPNLYPSNLNCWWLITSSETSGKVYIEVVQSQIEYSFSCINDFVSVRDGDENGDELGRFCGSQKPSYTSTQRSIYILFRTNTDINNMGFKLKYITTRACLPGHITELSVSQSPSIIKSPDYPNNYPQNVNCLWRLHSNMSLFIQVNVLESDIQSSYDCRYDHVAAYDGATEHSQEMKRWCGTETPSFTSSGSVLLLKFQTDGSGFNTGFKLEYLGVNTAAYSSSPLSMKAGMIAGVTCGVVVITTILIVIIFVIVRRKHKNQQPGELDRNHRHRRSRRSGRLPPRYEESAGWEVNHVFYSTHSGDGIMSPPPYSLVAGCPIPSDPPPPYPAAEFVMPPKEEEEGLHTGGPVDSQSDPQLVELPVEASDDAGRSGQREESLDQPRPKPRPRMRTDVPPPRQGRQLKQTDRAVSVDNLTPGSRPLSLLPVSREQTGPLSAPARSVSVDNLSSGRADPPRREYASQVSQSEMVLNRDQVRDSSTPTYRAHRSPEHRPSRRPERPARQRDREGRGTRNKSDCTSGDRTAHRSPPRHRSGYQQNPRQTSRSRGQRSRPRSEFDDLKHRSRSCENLASERLSLPNDSNNPRWSIASEGYMNDRHPTEGLGRPSRSVSHIPDSHLAPNGDRAPARSGPPVDGSPQKRPDESSSSTRGRERHVGSPQRQVASPERRPRSEERVGRPVHHSSRGNLSRVEEEVSGYAKNRPGVVFSGLTAPADEESNEGPTETSV